jgi:hypothetical protein
MTKLIAAFRNFGNASKKREVIGQLHVQAALAQRNEQNVPTGKENNFYPLLGIESRIT